MKHAGKKNTGKRKDRLMTMILVCVFMAGLAILLYPTVSDWWNERVSTRAVAAYEEAVASMSVTDYTAWFEAADAYNQNLAYIGSASVICNPGLVEDYWETLNITGTGVMGYITIDKIDVRLPVYHGTDAGVLQIAAGHLEGSSLPVGGESTHCVISAHRGLPSARLFTDLDQLEAGDIFTVTVLDRVLTYEVDQISIVEPDEIENLYIEEGKDYCTLMTCTPYGINSHRLLVRGVRTENASDGLIKVSADACKVDTMTVASVLAVLILLVLLAWLSGSTRRRRQRGGSFMKNILNGVRFAVTIMLMIALTMGADLTACAAADSTSLDLARSGSVSLTMKNLSGEVLTDGAVTLYQVAVLDLNNGDMVYVRTEAFVDCAEAPDLDDSSLAAVLAEYVIDNGIRGTEVFIGPDGTVSFDNLNLGLYLVVQTTESAGYSAILPFLVTLPYAENGTWIYDVDASPKVEPSLESEKPETPAGSGTPESPVGFETLPQTGQMNWPIPLLAFGGLLFLTMGWFLFMASGKEKSHTV